VARASCPCSFVSRARAPSNRGQDARDTQGRDALATGLCDRTRPFLRSSGRRPQDWFRPSTPDSPAGTTDHSPAFQRWVPRSETRSSPAGAKERPGNAALPSGSLPKANQDTARGPQRIIPRWGTPPRRDASRWGTQIGGPAFFRPGRNSFRLPPRFPSDESLGYPLSPAGLGQPREVRGYHAIAQNLSPRRRGAKGVVGRHRARLDKSLSKSGPGRRRTRRPWISLDLQHGS